MSYATCRLCGSKRALDKTLLCNRCWELYSRIERDTVLARRILAEIEQNMKQQERELLEEDQ